MNRTSFNQAFALSLDLIPASRTATASSSIVDTQGYDEFAVEFLVGTATQTLSTSTYIQALLEHSDATGSGWAVTTAHTGQIANASNGEFLRVTSSTQDDVVAKTSYFGEKRYLRVADVRVGTQTVGTITSVVSVRGRPMSAPV